MCVCRTPPEGWTSDLSVGMLNPITQLILVAAAALGCGLTNAIWSFTEAVISWKELGNAFIRLVGGPLRPSETQVRLALELSLVQFLLLAPIVAAGSTAVIPIRLTGPRPRWRRLMMQPGLVASLGALPAFCGIAVFWVFCHWHGPRGGWDPTSFILIAPIFVGLSVLGAWMTLILGGRWRPERSWIDRLGRACGVFWISAGVAICAGILLLPL